MKKLILIAACTLIPTFAHAEDAHPTTVSAMKTLMSDKPGCTLTQNAQVSVNFNSIEKDAETAGGIFDSKVADIQNAAKDIKLEKLDVQSMNYSLYPYNNGTMGAGMQWQLNGSISFTVLPAEKAKDLLTLLVKKGFQPSLNVNAYRNGVCQ